MTFVFSLPPISQQNLSSIQNQTLYIMTVLIRKKDVANSGKNVVSQLQYSHQQSIVNSPSELLLSSMQPKKIKQNYAKACSIANQIAKRHSCANNDRAFRLDKSGTQAEYGIFACFSLRPGDEIIDLTGNIERYCNDAAMPDIFTQRNNGVNGNYVKLVEDYETKSLLHANIVRRPDNRNVYLCIKAIDENEELFQSFGLRKWSIRLQNHCCIQ